MEVSWPGVCTRRQARLALETPWDHDLLRVEDPVSNMLMFNVFSVAIDISVKQGTLRLFPREILNRMNAVFVM